MRIQYNRGDEILEVTIRDQTGAKIETRRCNLSDVKECGKILKWLKDKYGFTPLIEKSLFDMDTEFLKF
jgi:hypothetical protein